MKKIIMAVVLAGMSGAVYAVDFSDLQTFKASDVKGVTVPSSSPVASGASEKADVERQAADIVTKQIKANVAEQNGQGPHNLEVNSSVLKIAGVNTLLVLARYDFTNSYGDTPKMTCYAKFDPKTLKPVEAMVCLGSFPFNGK